MLLFLRPIYSFDPKVFVTRLSWSETFESGHCPVTKRQVSRHELAELLEQIGRIAYNAGSRAGLTPAQWTALRFFSRANRFSRTVSAFAEFHSTTRGTASQTIKGLVQQGYLTRCRSERDARSSSLKTTQKTLAALEYDPLEDLVQAAGVVSERTRATLAVHLTLVLGDLAARRGRRYFGSCTSCAHFQGAGLPGAEYFCGLVREQLAATEIEQICVKFQPGS